MRLQTEIPPQMYKDMLAYCENSELKVSEFIRHLIRIEIYVEQSLKKPRSIGELRIEFDKYVSKNKMMTKEQVDKAFAIFLKKKGIQE